MSNDLALFSNNLPDYLKEVGLDDMTKALAGNTGMKRISIRGGVFRMMVSGEEIAKNENRAMLTVRQKYRVLSTLVSMLLVRLRTLTAGLTTATNPMQASSTHNTLLAKAVHKTSRALVKAIHAPVAISNAWLSC